MWSTMPRLSWCFRGDGLTCRNPTPRIVADVSPRRGGQWGVRAPRVKGIGSKTAARRGGLPATQPRPSQRKRRQL
nr:MAG TPA: hypothetical protein [Caudoviricetes sp.]